MRRVHGEYPFERGGAWHGLWRYLLQAVPKGVVDAFLAEVPVVDDDQGELPNKGFRVVRVEYSAEGGVVVAVYKHDDEYHLIQAREDDFIIMDEARSGALKHYRTPKQRLPYPEL